LATRGSPLLSVTAPRCFQSPWDIEEYDQRCFIVRDNNRMALAYVYFEKKAGRRTAAGLLIRDEARRIAANIAKGVYFSGPRRRAMTPKEAPT
jgi:hypothetical protein